MPFFSLMVFMLRRAISIAFWMAIGHFFGLAGTETDLAVAVADDDQRGKTEHPAALDHLGYTIDADQLFEQIVAGGFGFEISHSKTP